jgi:hypothetical protein
MMSDEFYRILIISDLQYSSFIIHHLSNHHLNKEKNEKDNAKMDYSYRHQQRIC